MNRSRQAMTLLELLFVIGILAVLIGLLLPAVAQVRLAAGRLKSMNNIRQCTLALHNYSDAKQRLPSLDGALNPSGHSLMFELLPYVEEENFYRACMSSGTATSAHTIKMYLSPADPTVDLSIPTNNLASYAANAFVFTQKTYLPSSFTDGTSNTIAFAEHYAKGCGGAQFSWFVSATYKATPPSGIVIWVRRASFAEPVYLYDIVTGEPIAPDVFPVTSGNPPTTDGSVPGLTFQAKPSLGECNPRIAQTPHSGGMLVCMFDGSVRTVSPAIASSMYWGMVTPSGGEVVAD